MHSLLRVRAIAAALPKSASLSRRNTIRLCSGAAATPSDGAEIKSASEEGSWPKPSTIPFQAKVANSVNLIGRIHMPVQCQSAPDGKFWAGTVITQDQSSPLWIPIIFEGDLAHIAVSHLKENDRICIEGQLSAGPQTVDVSPGQCSAQVLVRSVNFVDGSAHTKPIAGFSKFEKSAAGKQGNSFSDTKRQNEDSWRNLINIPEDWSDYRKAKLDGLVSQKYPDFKRKDKTASLWLDSAPQWVTPNIQGLEFGGNNDSKLPMENKGDEAWKDLVANPDKWWDNRSDKPKPTYPDFRHKDTKQGLWLSSSPSWVLSKLPPLKQQEETSGWVKAAPKSSIET